MLADLISEFRSFSIRSRSAIILSRRYLHQPRLALNAAEDHVARPDIANAPDPARNRIWLSRDHAINFELSNVLSRHAEMSARQVALTCFGPFSIRAT